MFVQANLQTIPEDMCMSRRSSSRTHLVVPSSFAEKVITTCDGLASSLFISFFCCFQFSLMATDFISSSFLKLYMVMMMLYMVIERKPKSSHLIFSFLVFSIVVVERNVSLPPRNSLPDIILFVSNSGCHFSFFRRK